MAYLHYFTNTDDFNRSYYGTDYLEPWVSLTEDSLSVPDDFVTYNKKEYDRLFQMPLTFEVMSDGYVNWRCIDTAKAIGNLKYSKDSGETWTEITATTAGTQISVQSGDTVMFKNDTSTYANNNSFCGTTCQFNVKGNIMSIINEDNFITNTEFKSTGTSAFGRLFTCCTTLINAKDLIMPAKTLRGGMYQAMFMGCTNLKTGPELPATSVSGGTYYFTFSDCPNLEFGPSVLPAETLSERSYCSMFQNCTSLVKAPEIKAKNFAPNCCFNMFKKCASLVDAPSVIGDSTSIISASGCSAMFAGCTNLTGAPSLPAISVGDMGYEGMFLGCSALTHAPELPATTVGVRGYNQMFMKCSGLTYAPSSVGTNNTTIGNSACTAMFQECVSLVSAPELPIMNLSPFCYVSMFWGCSSLETAPELPATTLTECCYTYCVDPGAAQTTIYPMFGDCSGLIHGPSVLPAITLLPACYAGLFSNCSSLVDAPALPATTLQSDCYSNMFQNCTSLTTAPVLPASEFKTRCYQNLFKNCTNLNYIKCLAYNVGSAQNPTANWVLNVQTNSGRFIKDSRITEQAWERGNNGIPQNWTVQNA